jgi:hypothetical protein
MLGPSALAGARLMMTAIVAALHMSLCGTARRTERQHAGPFTVLKRMRSPPARNDEF